MNYNSFIKLLDLLDEYTLGKLKEENKVKVSDLRKIAAECDEELFKVNTSKDDEFIENLFCIVRETVSDL